jgi:hypothetical protein
MSTNARPITFAANRRTKGAPKPIKFKGVTDFNFGANARGGKKGGGKKGGGGGS